MPVNQVAICNSALVNVGAAIIQSIDEPSKGAKTIKAIWDITRKATLRAHPWNFAMKRATLAPISDAPNWGYDYAFDIPNDCLIVRSVSDNDIDYVIEDNKILSDESELEVQYTYDHQDESEWDGCFCDAFAWNLSHKIAYAMTQTTKVVEAMEAGYMGALKLARTMDGAEGVLKDLEVITWTRARR